MTFLAPRVVDVRNEGDPVSLVFSEQGEIWADGREQQRRIPEDLQAVNPACEQAPGGHGSWPPSLLGEQ